MALQRFLLFSVLLTSLANADRTVLTESGPVRGKTVPSGRVEAYLGIPYAEPPVGQLRFAKPVPKMSWTDVLEATKMPPPCIQLDTKVSFMSPDLSRMSEDCLYLNVWVPRSDEGKPKTVMFFIHGGGFMLGSSDTKVYDGAKLSEYGDVVVVTINYRVGVLGFFTGDTEDAPGNLAIHDQILALQWVKENARHFNGDPDSIVIFGHSAGAFSVSLHQLSPSSKNLFKRAILQSGSAVNPLYSVGNKEAARINSFYAQELRCASKNSINEDVLKCMRDIPAEAFAKADAAAFQNEIFLLLPRFGEELFPKGAISLFKEGQFKDSEVLLGVTRDEGSFSVWFIYNIIKGTESDGDVKNFFNRTTAYEAIKRSPLTRTLFEITSPEEAERIIQDYLDGEDNDSSKDASYMKVVSDVLGDVLLTCGAVFQAEYQSAKGDPVYFYMFDHQTTNSPFPKWMGVPHFEEVPYVFGNPLVGDFTEEEKELSRDVMHMWTAFAKTGNPTIPGGLQWPRYTPEDPKYYVIGRKDRVDTKPDNHRCERWRSIFLGTDR